MKAENNDPFYEAEREVHISVKKLQHMYSNWNSLPDKNSILAKEKYYLMKDEIKYLNKDVDDLENSIDVVKKNTHKFNISTEEIENRTKSLKNIRAILNDVASDLTNTVLSPNNYMMDDYNNMAINKQNDDLEELAESAERLHNAAITINTELKDQQRLLDELESEMDNSNEKMNFVTKKISDYLQTNNPKILSLILYLTGISIFLLFVLVVS
ncbi:syntaxin-6, putative [Plasmodium chabaudi chabaudi]|uniref:Syntaxin-6, putative n=1 Tax=Plasmodium chabaudi chabaudi TaxID=31271 RepID=A0A4V0KBL4_PLACU|nr:syntaxin-6, putative [Plasmodium chabaudi chabaudi]VTZ70145.1 syntaxin-6, putative [Plasmodium chabaudi chabaudi]|eukprot:XP_016654504.1 SNARE protein, putative [Plasmodium chabaudi chabaudi]